jgi:hypothetical protein
MIFRRWVALLLLLLNSLGSSSALAAKNAVVNGKGVILRADPNSSGQSVARLSDGEPVLVSNYPTQGFYKVRTGSGQIGWVDANAINVGGSSTSNLGSPDDSIPPPSSNDPLPRPPTTLGAPTDVQVIPYEDVKPTTDYEVRQVRVPVDHPRYPYELKAFGGFQLVRLTEVNQLVGTTVTNSAFYFGLQFGIPLDDRMNILFRLEEITRSVSNGSISGVPIMTGLSYSLLKERPKKVRLKASLLVGVAGSTNFTENSGNTTTQYSGSAFTEMLKFDLDIPISRYAAIFGETGYRYLKTASVGPTVNGNPAPSSTIIPIDLSGLFIGVGIGFRL